MRATCAASCPQALEAQNGNGDGEAAEGPLSERTLSILKLGERRLWCSFSNAGILAFLPATNSAHGPVFAWLDRLLPPSPARLPKLDLSFSNCN